MASDGCAGSSPARGTESNKRTKETTQACLYVVSFVLLLCFCKFYGGTPIGSPALCNSHKSPSISPTSLLVSCLYCSFIGLLQVLRRDSHRKSRPLLCFCKWCVGTPIGSPAPCSPFTRPLSTLCPAPPLFFRNLPSPYPSYPNIYIRVTYARMRARTFI